MTNVSVLLVGGDLDGQTYTAKPEEKALRIHSSEKNAVVTDTKVKERRDEKPAGKWYIYAQESEGSNRFIFQHEEEAHYAG